MKELYMLLLAVPTVGLALVVDPLMMRLFVKRFVWAAAGAVLGAVAAVVLAIPPAVVYFPSLVAGLQTDQLVLSVLAAPGVLAAIGCLGWIAGCWIGGLFGALVRSPVLDNKAAAPPPGTGFVSGHADPEPCEGPVLGRYHAERPAHIRSLLALFLPRLPWWLCVGGWKNRMQARRVKQSQALVDLAWEATGAARAMPARPRFSLIARVHQLFNLPVGPYAPAPTDLWPFWLELLFPDGLRAWLWRYRAWIIQNHRDKWMWERPVARPARAWRREGSAFR